MKKIITLVDEKKAKKGYEFIHFSIPEECKECNLFSVCMGNLELGRRYRIVGTRDYEHPCKIFGKVKVVEVEEPEIQATVESRVAFVGSKITFKSIECKDIDCKNFPYCSAEGLKSGDRCEIVEVIKKVECKIGKDLTLVKLKRIQKSRAF